MTHTISPQVRMANDIALQFQHWTDKEAAATAIANHIKRFWTPRMRADLLNRVATEPQTVDPLAISAAQQLN
jgi:formate dehydrogenase subunit delta